jgi:hypothetical protein
VGPDAGETGKPGRIRNPARFSTPERGKSRDGCDTSWR